MSKVETKTDVFQFMSVRSPQSLEEDKLRNFYIKDDYISPVNDAGQEKVSTRKLREIFSMNSNSSVGKILYESIFCKSDGDLSMDERNASIVFAVMETLDFQSVLCEVNTDTAPETLINDLEQAPYIFYDEKYYKLPTQLKSIESEFKIRDLLSTGKIIETGLNSYRKNTLLESLRELFGAKILTDIVYQGEEYHPAFLQLKGILFEKLYTLYILRRITTVNLEEILKGLQILHTLEYLAVDDFCDALYSKEINPNDSDVATTLKLLNSLFPELDALSGTLTKSKFAFIKNAKDLENYFQSTPVIHPIVAKLAWYKKPFNDIKPIGIGDLKVVKQWLCGYKVGEISHINNIMKGEIKDRTLRHLEKTEEVFSFSSENNSNTQQENQTTDRFEVKRETEKIIKTDINAGANANFTYKNDAYGITTSVGGNFAYANSNQDNQKTASNFARDVMDKAVTNVQTRSSQNRSISKIYETEETNKHGFDNAKGTSHTSGIYRWLDKKYKAQLYNYGKRLMFEFIIPEPAAFYVTSKLAAAEFSINSPEKPPTPTYETVRIIKPGTENQIPDPTKPDIKGVELIAANIDQTVFNQLRSKYDIGDLIYSGEKIETLYLTNPQGGSNQFNSDKSINYDQQPKSFTHTCVLDKNNFKITNCVISGRVRYWDQAGEDSSLDFEKNIFKLLLNNEVLVENEIPRGTGVGDALIQNVNYTKSISVDISNSTINLELITNDIHWYELTFLVTISTAEDITAWQNRVYNKIKSIEQALVDKKNQEIEIRYNTKLSDYQNALNELNTQIVNDIIQGKSESYNRTIIEEELKKHCITMITKEFDADESDDILSNEDAIVDKEVLIEYEKFFAGEIPDIQAGSSVNANSKLKSFVGFIKQPRSINYPKIEIDIARKKARYIQFLEQAFEWTNIAYLFYPYFWAKESKWIKLMNRLDYTDSNMTAFLKAGSVRVLIAVTPAYNEAVMHFLATREPWEGGPLPVIGDPLFIPLYEEIRQQQDDLEGAKPEGKPWDFELPTSLVYLQDSSSSIPTDLQCPPE